jgi:hypothetical protein
VFRGRIVETVAEVTAYEPDRRWARRASGPIRPEVTYRLDPISTGTRVRFTFDIPVMAGAARILWPVVPVIRRVAFRSFRTDLGQLKQRVETKAETS